MAINQNLRWLSRGTSTWCWSCRLSGASPTACGTGKPLVQVHTRRACLHPNAFANLHAVLSSSSPLVPFSIRSDTQDHTRSMDLPPGGGRSFWVREYIRRICRGRPVSITRPRAPPLHDAEPKTCHTMLPSVLDRKHIRSTHSTHSRLHSPTPPLLSLTPPRLTRSSCLHPSSLAPLAGGPRSSSAPFPWGGLLTDTGGPQ